MPLLITDKIAVLPPVKLSSLKHRTIENHVNPHLNIFIQADVQSVVILSSAEQIIE